LDITVVLTVFKSRIPWMVSSGRRHWEPLADDQNCSHLGTAQHFAKKICRSAVTSCLSHAAQIVGSLRELTGAV